MAIYQEFYFSNCIHCKNMIVKWKTGTNSSSVPFLLCVPRQGLLESYGRRTWKTPDPDWAIAKISVVDYWVSQLIWIFLWQKYRYFVTIWHWFWEIMTIWWGVTWNWKKGVKMQKSTFCDLANFEIFLKNSSTLGHNKIQNAEPRSTNDARLLS